MKNIAVGLAALLLVVCLGLAVAWWATLAVHRPTMDGSQVAVLAGLGALQVASWAVVFRLWVRARLIPSTSLSLYVAGLALALTAGYVAFGLIPGLGIAVELLVIGTTLVGFVAARRLTQFCS